MLKRSYAISIYTKLVFDLQVDCSHRRQCRHTLRIADAGESNGKRDENARLVQKMAGAKAGPKGD